MAHRRHHYRHHEHHRRNPGIPHLFGADLEDLGAKAAGLALTQWLDQQFAQPLSRQVFKNQAGVMGKLVDVGTTALSAVVAGEGVGLLSHRYGDDVKTGGLILTVGKGIGVIVPGFSLGSPSLPAALNRFGLPGGGGALTAVAPGAAVVPLMALPPGGQPNYPRPATVDSDVGI